MIRNHDLAALEKRVYISQFDDGLLDLLSGLGVFLIGLAWMSDVAWLGALIPAILFPFWSVARKQITEPRAGLVHMGSERRLREFKRLFGLALLGLLILSLGLFLYYLAVRSPEGPGAGGMLLVAGLPCLLLALAAMLVSLSFGLTRFLVHAAFLLAGGVGVILLGTEPGVGLIASGASIAGMGLVLLYRFVRQHPIPEREPGS